MPTKMPTKMPTNSKLLLTIVTAATALGGASATQVASFEMIPSNLVATSTPTVITYTFTPTVALAPTETFTITHNVQRYAANDAVTCVHVDSVVNNAGSITCVASGGLLGDPAFTGTILTCTLESTKYETAVISADGEAWAQCTSNIFANPAPGAQTTTMVTTNDVTEYADEFGDAASVTYTADVFGKCSGNAVTDTNLAKNVVDYVHGEKIANGLFEFDCGPVHLLKANPDTITATGDAVAMKTACCAPRTGKCAGNAASAGVLTQASTPAGSFQFDCGDFILKTTANTIDWVTGAGADSQIALCCDDPAGMCMSINGIDVNFCGTGKVYDAGARDLSCASDPCSKEGETYHDADVRDCCKFVNPVSGKCSGNTATATDLDEEVNSDGTFQFACGDGSKLKESSATITPADASDAAATKTECCDTLPTCTKSDNTALAAKCDCGGAGYECDEGNYCYDKTATTTVCEWQPKPAACLTDGKVTPFAKDQKMYFESCKCTDAKECTLGSVCDTKGTTNDALCKCTPSDTQWCYQSKIKDVRDTDAAVLFGCFNIGGKYII